MNTTVIDFMLNRKSVPISAIGTPGPNAADLDLIFKVAVRVPDHGRLSPWRFIVYEGESREKVGRLLAELAERREGPLDDQRRQKELTRFSRAPMVIGVIFSPKAHERIPEWEMYLSGGAVAMNLVIAANALGYATNWITNWYSSDPEGRRILGLTPNERVVGFIHIGHFDGKVPERPRPDHAELVSIYDGPAAKEDEIEGFGP